jgi:hypothetical protein
MPAATSCAVITWRNTETREDSLQRPGNPVFVESQSITQSSGHIQIIISYRPFEFAF